MQLMTGFSFFGRRVGPGIHHGTAAKKVRTEVPTDDGLRDPSEQATLVLHGDVSLATLPHLAFVLDSMIALDIPSLRVDVADASHVSPDAIATIRQREGEEERFVLVGGPER